MAEETKTDKDAAKLRRSFKIACGLIAAYFIVPPGIAGNGRLSENKDPT